MSTYREIVYMVLDELKVSSDDSYYTEDHIVYLANNYRAFLLKQKYETLKTEIPPSNYITLCIDLIQVPAISGEPCEGPPYLRSTKPIPPILLLGIPVIYPIDYFQGHHISYVPMQRMRYTGFNRWLSNMIYATIAPDHYLYLKSFNPQFLYLEKIRFTALFEDPKAALDIMCGAPCDILDMEFPLEADLIPQLIELIVNELKKSLYSPEADTNNAADDSSDLASFLQRAVKSNTQIAKNL